MFNDDLVGVILAGGKGTRLNPLTKKINKHMLPVGDVPMIYHPISALVSTGIKEIIIVSGCDHMGQLIEQLGSGRDFGCTFTYKVQDEAGGIAQALGIIENIVSGHKVVVLLGDNVFEDSLDPILDKFLGRDVRTSGSALIAVKEVHDPSRFGVAEIFEGKIVSIVEKPKEPKSNLAVVGIYCYPPDVFSVIKTLKPSERGELEITDVNNWYASQNRLSFFPLQGWWTDAGTQESYLKANELARSAIKRK